MCPSNPELFKEVKLKFIKFSILIYISVFAFQLITHVIFPETIGRHEWVSWVVVTLLCLGMLGLWFAPAVVAFRAKQIRHRVLVILFSLGLPLVGGFVSYFILKGELKYQTYT